MTTTNTSITSKQVRLFEENYEAPKKIELHCKLIKGLHLQKTKTKTNWKYRFSDINRKRKTIVLCEYE